MYEEYGYILDVIADRESGVIAQIIGESYFKLFEVSIIGESISVGDRVYIGKENRDVVQYIRRTIHYENLTKNSKFWLPFVLGNIVRNQEEIFIKFFNTVGQLPTKHGLLLLAKVQMRDLDKFLEERQKRPFESYFDIIMRTGIPVIDAITNRIILEIAKKPRYYLFVRPKDCTKMKMINFY